VRRALPLALALLLAGCASTPAPKEAAAWQALAGRYPRGAGFRLQQRVTLTVLGREYPMLASLAVASNGRWRMQASSEMGGLLFDLLGDTATACVLRAPQGMGEKPLLQGLAQDLRALYLGGPRDCQALALQGPAGFSLENRCWHYRLEAHDLKIRPGTPPVSAFVIPTPALAP